MAKNQPQNFQARVLSLTVSLETGSPAGVGWG